MHGMELKLVGMGIRIWYGIETSGNGNQSICIWYGIETSGNGNQSICVWYWNETSGMGVNTCMQAGKLFAASVDLRR